MHARHQETSERNGLAPPVTNSVSNGVTISDDISMDSSAYSQHSEPEGEFRDDDDGLVLIPQPLPAPNIVNEAAATVLFLREILQSMLLGELQYLLHPILVRGLVGILTNILLLNGFLVPMESWNILISVSSNSKMLWGNSIKIYLLLHLV